MAQIYSQDGTQHYNDMSYITIHALYLATDATEATYKCTIFTTDMFLRCYSTIKTVARLVHDAVPLLPILCKLIHVPEAVRKSSVSFRSLARACMTAGVHIQDPFVPGSSIVIISKPGNELGN